MMAMRRIMVPVDGSTLSEKAVPLAREIALAQQAVVDLVYVVTPFISTADGWGMVAPDAETCQTILDAIDEEARAVLRRLAEGLHQAGVHATAQLLRGSAALALLDYEAEARPDLVVIGTHGRGGLTRFALGSVADRFVRDGTAPTLLVRATVEAPRALERALVPLDGSAVAESCLPLVQQLAGKPLRFVHFFEAIDEEEGTSDAQAYLEGIAAPLQAAGLATHVAVGHGPAEATIVAAARGMDLVIMSTHGRGGFDRLRHGSVAEQLVRELPIPVLLTRVVPTQGSSAAPATSLAAGEPIAAGR